MLDAPGWRGRSLRAFGLGAVLGGLITFTLAGLIAEGLEAISLAGRISVYVAIMLGVGAIALGRVQAQLPQNARLVPQYVAMRGPIVGFFQFGFEMGTGLRTYVTSLAPYALASGVILLGGVSAGSLAGIGFGVGRTSMLVSTLASGDTSRWISKFGQFERRLDVFAVVTTCGCIGRALVGS